MNIAILLPPPIPSLGGLSTNAQFYINYYKCLGHDVHLFFSTASPLEINPILNSNIHLAYTYFEYPLSFSVDLLLLLLRGGFDLVDVHGLWSTYSIYVTILRFFRSDITIVYTPHGMLDPWSFDNSHFNKRIFWFLFERGNLIKSKVIRVFSETEKSNVEKLFPDKTIAVIPHALSSVSSCNHFSSDSKNFCFVGRFHRVKNIESLLSAWNSSKASRQGYELHIVGNGDPSYFESLKCIADEMGLISVRFLFAKSHQDCLSRILHSRALILPSLSENFGLVILEALSLSTPVIVNKGLPWDFLEHLGCGIVVDCIDVNSFALAIDRVAFSSKLYISQMSSSAYSLFHERFSSKTVISSLANFYGTK